MFISHSAATLLNQPGGAHGEHEQGRERDGADAAERQPLPLRSADGSRGEPEGAGEAQGSVVWPTYADIVGILYELAAGLFGTADHPFPAFNVMNRGLLESAIALPHQPYYETFWDKLAAMVRSIAANHALHDGNKRLAVTVLHSTLIVNGWLYVWDDDSAVVLMERCATGESDYHWLSLFIECWSFATKDRAEWDAATIRGLMEQKRKALENEYQTISSSCYDHARAALDPRLVEAWLPVIREMHAEDGRP